MYHLITLQNIMTCSVLDGSLWNFVFVFVWSPVLLEEEMSPTRFIYMYMYTLNSTNADYYYDTINIGLQRFLTLFMHVS